MDEDLRSEARAFSRYLLDTDPPAVLIERYCQAARTLFDSPPADPDGAVLDFVHRHPWSLPMLDAAMGLRRPQGLLRGKLVLMLALLETTPELSPRFEPQSLSLTRLVFRLGRRGVTSLTKIAAGLVLYALCVRRPR